MLEELFTSKVRVKLLKVFVEDPDTPRYLRELERDLDLPLSPLRRELLNLVKKGLLTTRRDANIKYYFVNKESDMFGRLTDFFHEEETESNQKEAAVSLTNHQAEETEEETVSTVSNSMVKFVDALLVFIFIIACINIYLVTNLRINVAQTKAVYYPLVQQVALMQDDTVIAEQQGSSEADVDAAVSPQHIDAQDKKVVEKVARKTQAPKVANQMSSSNWRMSFGAWNAGTTVWDSGKTGPQEHEL